MTTAYEKRFTALKYYLLGRGHTQALKALQFTRQWHNGTRKDGVTPESQHQLEICLYLTTLKDLVNENLILTCALLHDVMEDYDVPIETMKQEFGEEVTTIVLTLSKKYQGIKKTPEAYFRGIQACPIASVVKGADRVHNLQTMVGVFDRAKQTAYVAEVKVFFLPMLKAASYAFPEQTQAYANIKHVLKSQMTLIEAALANKTFKPSKK